MVNSLQTSTKRKAGNLDRHWYHKSDKKHIYLSHTYSQHNYTRPLDNPLKKDKKKRQAETWVFPLILSFRQTLIHIVKVTRNTFISHTHTTIMITPDL